MGKIRQTGRRGGFGFCLIFTALLFNSCGTSGPVDTNQSDSTLPIVAAPTDFISPLEELDRVRKQVAESESTISLKTKSREAAWYQYASLTQSWDELESEQANLEGELVETGEIQLYPGRSYSFNLESYCVNAGQARPTTGDELKVSLLRGPAQSWLPKILAQQTKQDVSQEQLQYLIWALLYDTRFDELSSENQQILLQFYPDAVVRFGNRRLGDVGKNVIRSLLPDSVTATMDQITEYRSQVLKLQNDYRALEHVLVPPPDHLQAIPVGWMQMPEGYLMRLTSDSYSRVRVDIYVPKEGRSPQAVKALVVFRPSRWIGLPAQGQRLAISSKATRRSARDTNLECKKLREWRPTHCHAIMDADREKILALADPKKFPNTWYQSPPKPGYSIQQRIDCSNFVKEIFSQAGFNYEYSPTRSFRCLKVFEQIPDGSAKPGDLVLYRTHIGIFDSTGNVTSATQGGPLHLSFLKKDETPAGNPKVSAIQTLPRDKVVLHPEAGVILRWRCP